jgi:hypothetical protein
MVMLVSAFSGVAALAALLAVYFARATVQEARRNRSEEALAHREAMASEERLLEATNASHEQEMQDRYNAVEREMWVERLTQLGRVQELLGNVVDTTGTTIALREEAGRPMTVGIGDTRVSCALLRAEVGVAILAQLGGPSLPEFAQAAERGRVAGTSLHEVEAVAAATLNTVRALAQSDPTFRLRRASPHWSSDLADATNTIPNQIRLKAPARPRGPATLVLRHSRTGGYRRCKARR